MTSNDVEGELFCFSALNPDPDGLPIDDKTLMAYKATADPDTMYLHQAMKQPDRKEFLKAM